MMNDKATENLAAGDLLLGHRLVSASASRFYYSMFQAAVHELTRRGLRPESIRSGARDWDHSMVENNCGLLRRSPEDRALYREMRALRIDADYRGHPTDAADVISRRAAVADFVKELSR